MTLTHTAARGTAVTVGAQLVRVVLQFGGIIILARILMPEDYALVAMVMAVIGFADIVRDGGLSTAAVQSPTLSIEERSNLFWANTGLGAACTAVACALTPLIVALYDQPRLSQVVPALAGLFVMSGVNTQYRVSLLREMRFGALAGADIVAQGIAIAAAVAAAWLGLEYWALVLQQLIAGLVVLAVNAANSHWLPRWPRRDVSIRRFFRFGLKVLGTQALNYGTNAVDEIVLGAVQGATTLGLYNRAKQIVVTPLSQVDIPLTRVALPVLARAQDDDARFAHAAGRAQLIGCYITATMLAVVAGVAEPLVRVLLGPGWLGVAPILTVLSIAGIFRSMAYLSYWLFLARGRPGAQLKLDMWARPIMMIMIVAGVPWGGVGVAAASVLAWALFWAAGLVVVGRSVRIPTAPLFRRAAVALLGTALPVGVSSWAVSTLVGGAVLGLAAGLGAAAAALTLVSLLVAPVRRDVSVLLGLVRQAVHR